MRFAGLAVCIVDEQHRFGVRQRAALDAKGPGEAAPHVLHMTATPIPRTLSLTAYGDLDATTIRELPAGRRPVKTWVVGEEKRAGAYGFIRDRLREGRQAYVVCPLVSDSEKLRAKAAAVEAERLRGGELSDFRVGLLHGQLSSREKAAEMEAFAAGDIDVLVATTVIEVGIDVAERDRDADRGGRAVRAVAAASAARPGRARRAREPVHPVRRDRGPSWRSGGWRRSSARATASSSPRSTSCCAGRARSSARCSSGLPRYRVAAAARRRRAARRRAGRGAWSCSSATAASRRPSSARCSTPRGRGSATNGSTGIAA